MPEPANATHAGPTMNAARGRLFEAPVTARHTAFDDVQGLLSGCLLVSLGVLFQPTFLGVGPALSDASVDLAPYLGVNLNSIVDAIRSE